MRTQAWVNGKGMMPLESCWQTFGLTSPAGHHQVTQKHARKPFRLIGIPFAGINRLMACK